MSIGRDDFNHSMEKIKLSEKIEDLFELISSAPQYKFSDEQLHLFNLAIVTKYPFFLEIIPTAKRHKDICLVAIEQMPTLRYLIPPELYFNDETIRDAIVSRIGTDLFYVPEQMRNLKICVAAVNQTPSALAYVPEKLVDHDEFKKVLDICYNTIPEYPQALSWLPISKRSFDLCHAAVLKDYRAIIYVPDALLDRAEFKQAIENWRLDIMANVENIKFTPVKLLTQDICNAAVVANIGFMPFVPKAFLLDVCVLLMAKHNYSKRSLLTYFNHITKDESIKLDYLEHAKNNPSIFKLLNEEDKIFVVDTLGAEHFLQDDYANIPLLPQSCITDTMLTSMLRNIVHVVVTEREIATSAEELNDTFNVYANSPARKGKTIHVDTPNLQNLLTNLKKYQEKGAELNIVLLDHANSDSVSLAGINVNEMTDLLARNDNVTKVTLLGCNTVKAKQLDIEKVMESQYQAALKAPAPKSYSAVILSYDLPTEDQYAKFFDKMSTDKNKHPAETLYIFVYGSFTQSPCVIALKKDLNGSVTGQRYDQTDESMQQLGKVVGNKKASKNQRIIYYRGGNSTDNLTPDESIKVADIVNSQHPRFSKGHPQYKEDKKMFPFMAGVALQAPEEDKILPSLLKRLADAIKNNSDIQRDIAIKGYTKEVHVDKIERQMKVHDTHLYTPKYEELRFRFFSTEHKTIEDNLNRKKLAKGIKKEIDAMSSDEQEKDFTAVKSITVRVKPKGR